MKPSTNLHIKELVLDGFNPADRHRIGDAVQSELVRLLAIRGIAAEAADIPHINVGEFQPAPGARAEALGAQIAKNVHGALSHER
jgi:hypothetical protein